MFFPTLQKRSFSLKHAASMYYKTIGLQTCKTYLEVRNSTRNELVTLVRGVNRNYWGLLYRPDYNLDNRLILSGSILSEREEILAAAPANLYTLVCAFDVNTALVFRIDQAIGNGKTPKITNYTPNMIKPTRGSFVETIMGSLDVGIANLIIQSISEDESGIFTCTGNALCNVSMSVKANKLSIEIY